MIAAESADWVHFACHGYSDRADPSASHLVLHDQPLSVLDVNMLRQGRGQLALLSACSTARGAVSLANESIHLTAAFHLAGYMNVIGTLWPVTDDIACQLTGHLYSLLPPSASAENANQYSPGTALHEATQHIRRASPSTPSRWAAWIHVGI
jgi:CHAT domain-containing protein